MIDNECRDIKMPSFLYDSIERKVCALYKEQHINKIPIDPFAIIEKRGYILKTFSSLDFKAIDFSLRKKIYNKELDGFSYFDPEQQTFVICYDESQAYVRLRFTLMHEVGHIDLGHKEESALAKKMADYYAAYSLAPSPLIYHFDCQDFVELKDRFIVSDESADYSFSRFQNWLAYSGSIKPYEHELLALFE